MSVNPIISKVFEIGKIYYNPAAAGVAATCFRSYIRVISYQEPDGINVVCSADNKTWFQEEFWFSYQDIYDLYTALPEPIYYNRLSKVE